MSISLAVASLQAGIWQQELELVEEDNPYKDIAKVSINFSIRAFILLRQA